MNHEAEAITILKKVIKKRLMSHTVTRLYDLPARGLIAIEGVAQFKGRSSKVYWTAIFEKEGGEMVFIGYSPSVYEAHRMVNQYQTGYWDKQFKSAA